MHPEAFEWVRRHARDGKVLDIGGRDINGHPRDLFPGPYVVVDLHPGPNVDHVADVCEWSSRDKFDVVLCLEVFEHTHRWRAILGAAYRLARHGGRLIVTCAGPGREPHSALDGGPLHAGEWYENVDPLELHAALSDWRDVKVSVLGSDVRAVATK